MSDVAHPGRSHAACVRAMSRVGSVGCARLDRIVLFEVEPPAAGGRRKYPHSATVACPCGDLHKTADPQWRERRPSDRVEAEIVNATTGERFGMTDKIASAANP